MLMLLVLLLALAAGAYFLLSQGRNYWTKRGVDSFAPLPLVGNLKPLLLLEQCPGTFLGSLYSAPQAVGQRFIGMFLCCNKPALLVRDPELIKHLFVKDFTSFHNRYVHCDPEADPIGYNNLFVVRDDKWKYLRSKLRPVFSSGKMKLMFKLVLCIVDELIVNIENRLDNQQQVSEMKELACQFTTDVICSCAFGIQSNSLNNPKAIFREFGRMIFTKNFLRALEVRAFFFMHWFRRFFRTTLFNQKSTAFFRKVFWDAMHERERSGLVRNDFLDTLLQLKEDAAKKLASDPENPAVFHLEGDTLVAQSVLFFAAGFETTAGSISNALTELAFAPGVQERLRREMRDTLDSHAGQLTYDCLFEMKYLDMVVCETLRKYPAMPYIDRLCTENYRIPGTDVTIEKGTPVYVALYKGLHYDPHYYPDPERFDPERFNDEGRSSRPSFTWLPFGEGPHICIGMRFAHMTIKAALCGILLRYRVETTEAISMPLEMDKWCNFLAVKNGLLLKFSRLDP